VYYVVKLFWRHEIRFQAAEPNDALSVFIKVHLGCFLSFLTDSNVMAESCQTLFDACAELRLGGLP
jgi:hypothetical protein